MSALISSAVRRRSYLALAAAAIVFVGNLAGGTAAGAAVPGAATPAWQITSEPIPTVLPAGVGKKGDFLTAVENIGGAASSGTVTITDELPTGISVEKAEAEPGGSCSEPTAGTLVCELPEPIVSSGFIAVDVRFEVTGTVSTLANHVTVSGGGGSTVSSSEPAMRLAKQSGEVAPGGIEQFSLEATGPAGEPVSQAAAHPTLVTTRMSLNSIDAEDLTDNNSAATPIHPVEATKDMAFYLPVGLLGNPAITEPCPASEVILQGERSACPAASRVGTVAPFAVEGLLASANDPTSEHGIFSVVPEPGYAAQFEFGSNGLVFVMYANVVWHDGAYALRVSVPSVPEGALLTGFVASFYGDLLETKEVSGRVLSDDLGAFLTLPSTCETGAQAREATAAMRTWEQPTRTVTASSTVFPALEGCNLLPFSTAFAAGPETRVAGNTPAADAPSGYKLNLEAPQAPNTGTGFGTPPYKQVDFTFPQGTSLSPGAANGLTACAQTGANGIDFPSGTSDLGEGPGVPGEPVGQGIEGEVIGQEGLPVPTAGHCPSSSIVGTAKAVTPLLREPLEGHLYLAEPLCGNAAHSSPCTAEDAANGSIFRLYLELEAPQRGVIVKLPGSAHVNPSTGQITSVFQDTPQFPVSDLTIETTGGPRAALANPQTCGIATTTSNVLPWNGGPESVSTGSFDVDEDCGPHGFAPSFEAGTTDPLGGSYSPLTLTLKREDGEADITSLSTTLPQGLLAAVSHVSQCGEPQASAGGCPESSHVGTATVGIGSGSEPFYQTGQVYFTGPYDGDPFGLSVVVPAVAGPFNLGDVIVRVGLKVNPVTAQVTAETPAAGAPGSIPQIIDGVPLRIRTMNVTLSKPSFTINPTSCEAMSVTGSVGGTGGASAAVSSPFQAQGCKDLPFKPSFTLETKGKASHKEGASLVARVAEKEGEANIHEVEVRLPERLPARQSTLKLACTEAQFAANPADCPPESRVGTATAHTPILNAPLTGPGYFVSRGHAAFPDLVLMLQGEGVTIELVGKTEIKGHYTYSRFETVPDAPVSSFQLSLPQGPFSVLASGGGKKLCGDSLTAPTTLVGQNGAVVEQTTKVKVSGCKVSLSVLEKKLSGKHVLLKLASGTAGTVKISGDGVKSRKVKLAAGESEVKLTLDKAGRKLRREHEHTTLKLALKSGKSKVTKKTKLKL